MDENVSENLITGALGSDDGIAKKRRDDGDGGTVLEGTFFQSALQQVQDEFILRHKATYTHTDTHTHCRQRSE